MEDINIVINEVQENYTGKYLKFVTKNYLLDNKNISWECCYRSNTSESRTLSGVEIIAFIKESIKANLLDSKILLIDNYRYPVEKRVLEFPSGIIDPSDYDKFLHEENQEEMSKKVAVSTAARELKEETGYSGEFLDFFSIKNVNPIKLFQNIFYDPWKSSENGIICLFEVDKSKEENKNPLQSLDDAEIINVHEVKLSELLDFISNKIENENYGCSAHVYSFAMGLQFNSLFNNKN
jgi:8-oxo-dGTP pyrophosphatase MutT (NUDIX family)